jgi:hypothetical protein
MCPYWMARATRPFGRRATCQARVSTDGQGRAALAACAGLTRAAESGVQPCVRPAACVIFRDEGGREGGCADGWGCRPGSCGARTYSGIYL